MNDFEQFNFGKVTEKSIGSLPSYRIFSKVTLETLFSAFFSILKLQTLDSKNGICVSKFAYFQHRNFILWESDKRKTALTGYQKVVYLTEKKRIKKFEKSSFRCFLHCFEKAPILHNFCRNLVGSFFTLQAQIFHQSLRLGTATRC